ncbi:glycosyltransferase family 2 protein [Methanobrevibacter sp.]|uniref:glycosyltransferase family 2 protein n=1 Tax=Methanobrevibacter sp. TaxID=66852 RepID=UPI003864B09F
MEKIKVCIIVLCKNEMDILPFVRKYWERISADVIVYDNGSTDDSLEYLSSIPYVTIRHFDSDGHNDIIHKEVKERAYIEYKNDYDIIIITDMDEVFFFDDFKAVSEAFIDGGYNILMTPIISLCEDFKPPFSEDKYLHQLCHKFYRQRMNHMKGFDDFSKLSIFNTKVTDKVEMSVGQHYVKTSPDMKIMLSNNGFNLHIDKGFGLDYKYKVRQRMYSNLSDTNKRYGMAIEYADSYEKLEREYKNNQKNSFDINDNNCND